MPYTTKLLNFKTKVQQMTKSATKHAAQPKHHAAATPSGYYGKNSRRRFRPGTLALRQIR